jgi:hypothetical protein
MKRMAVILMILAIALANSSPSIAAAKAGAVCTKVNKKEVVGKKTFVCKKISGNLKWRLVATTKASENTAPKVVTPPESEITRNIQKMIDELSGVKPKQLVNFTVVAQDGVQQSQIAEIAKTNLDRVVAFAESMGLSFTRNYQILIGDRAWLAPQLPSDSWCSDKSFGVPGTASAGFCSYESGVIFMSLSGFLEENGKPRNRDFKKEADRNLISHSFNHEIFHALQAEATLQYAGSRGFFNPFWLNEGGANFAAVVVNSIVQKRSYADMRTWMTSYGNCMGQAATLKINDHLVNSPNAGNCGPYYAGFLWSEKLVSDTGKLNSLISLAKTEKAALDTLNYNPNDSRQYEIDRFAVIMKNNLDIDVKQFVPSAESYLISASAELSNWLLTQPTN